MSPSYSRSHANGSTTLLKRYDPNGVPEMIGWIKQVA